jgi:galactofuranose transport system permease protein
LVYIFCAFCAGIAGLVITSDIKGADANNAGLNLELDAILSVVMGGTSMNGGRIYLMGSIIGALFIQTLTTTILTRGVNPELTLVVKSVVVIIVCLLQSGKFRQLLSVKTRRVAA